MFIKLGYQDITQPVGPGTEEVFYYNSKNLTANYTLEANKNAMSAGPITIEAGVTVTVPDTTTWTVV